MPNVVLKQTRISYKTVFAVLYKLSDNEGYINVDSRVLQKHTSYSRKTIYQAIAFLKRVNLLELIEYRTGRGQHSTYKLNWFKTKPKQKVSPLKSIRTLRTHSPNEQPAALTEIISPNNKLLWNRCMKANRELLEVSPLAKKHARECANVLGRHIKGKTRGYARKVYERLREMLKHLKLPTWAVDTTKICGWFMVVLKNLFKPKPKRKRYADYNEYLKAMIEKEREEVLRKRGHRQESAPAEAWHKFNEEKNQKPLEWFE